VLLRKISKDSSRNNLDEDRILPMMVRTFKAGWRVFIDKDADNEKNGEGVKKCVVDKNLDVER
jgi:hypothetical protein